MSIITPQPLLPETFALFGDVIQAGLGEVTRVNEGRADRFDSGARLAVKADTLQNVAGNIAAQQDINVEARELNNTSGNLSSKGDMTLDLLGQLVNTQGKLASGGAMLLRRAVFDRVGLFDARFRMGETMDWVARADLAGGQIQLMFGNASSTLPHVRSGAVRPVAVTSARRAPCRSRTRSAIAICCSRLARCG